jgi:hypothetical protein
MKPSASAQKVRPERAKTAKKQRKKRENPLDRLTSFREDTPRSVHVGAFGAEV